MMTEEGDRSKTNQMLLKQKLVETLTTSSTFKRMVTVSFYVAYTKSVAI